MRGGGREAASRVFLRHLADFGAAYNFGRRLKALEGLTPMSSSARLEPAKLNIYFYFELQLSYGYCRGAASRQRYRSSTLALPPRGP